MSDSRIVTPRAMRFDHNKDAFDYPFDYVDENCARSIPFVPMIPLGDFPRNIQRWIWSDPGYNDENSWVALFELTPEEDGECRYAFMEAWCDFTGFGCTGWIHTYVAHDIPTLIQYAMSEDVYHRYIDTTTDEVSNTR